MIYQHTVNYIKNTPEYKKNTSAAGLKAYFDLNNNFQANLKIVPISGTVGKSCCAIMLTSILRNAEYKVGRLLSSHVFDLRERITINNQPIDHMKFAECATIVIKVVNKAKKTEPDSALANISSQELIFAISLAYFVECNCDLIIIDSGSPLDINILAALPSCSVNIITSIEDTNGDKTQTAKNLQSILPVIRQGMNEIICNIKQSDDFNMLSRSCATISCRLTIPAQAELEVTKSSLNSLNFTYRSRQYRLSNSAYYNINNAITVIEASYALRRMGMKIRSASIENGLFEARLSAKFDIISVSPTIIVDCATSPLKIAAMSDSLIKVKPSLINDKCIKLLYSEEIPVDIITKNSAVLFEDNNFINHGEIPINPDSPTFALKLRNALQELQPDEILLCIGKTEFIGVVIFETNKLLNNF